MLGSAKDGTRYKVTHFIHMMRICKRHHVQFYVLTYTVVKVCDTFVRVTIFSLCAAAGFGVAGPEGMPAHPPAPTLPDDCGTLDRCRAGGDGLVADEDGTFGCC